jgi:hypothetical protein
MQRVLKVHPDDNVLVALTKFNERRNHQLQ